MNMKIEKKMMKIEKEMMEIEKKMMEIEKKMMEIEKEMMEIEKEMTMKLTRTEYLKDSEGSTFPGAQGHMPLDCAVGP